MNNNYETNHESAAQGLAEGDQISALELLAAAGISATMVYDGDAHGCAHCAFHALSQAA